MENDSRRDLIAKILKCRQAEISGIGPEEIGLEFEVAE